MNLYKEAKEYIKTRVGKAKNFITLQKSVEDLPKTTEELKELESRIEQQFVFLVKKHLLQRIFEQIKEGHDNEENHYTTALLELSHEKRHLFVFPTHCILPLAANAIPNNPSAVLPGQCLFCSTGLSVEQWDVVTRKNFVGVVISKDQAIQAIAGFCSIVAEQAAYRDIDDNAEEGNRIDGFLQEFEESWGISAPYPSNPSAKLGASADAK